MLFQILVLHLPIYKQIMTIIHQKESNDTYNVCSILFRVHGTVVPATAHFLSGNIHCTCLQVETYILQVEAYQ